MYIAKCFTYTIPPYVLHTRMATYFTQEK